MPCARGLRAGRDGGIDELIVLCSDVMGKVGKSAQRHFKQEAREKRKNKVSGNS